MKVKILNLFFWWINERHRIYLNKEAGNPWPWTKDKILQEYKFTNVYRNLDAVSRELHQLVFAPYIRKGSEGWMRDMAYEELLFKICLFRMFNLPDTYRTLNAIGSPGLAAKWSEAKAKKALHAVANRGGKVFTGAYVITNNGSTRPKIDLVCEAVTELWRFRATIQSAVTNSHSIEQSVGIMSQYPMIGKFIAYELVCDFRWTPILRDADDIYEWANPGPGAKRGLNRIHGRDLKQSMPERELVREMKELLLMSPKLLEHHMVPLEMRDIEHSLCEFDKYMRVKNGEGRPRSKYDATKYITRYL